MKSFRDAASLGVPEKIRTCEHRAAPEAGGVAFVSPRRRSLRSPSVALLALLACLAGGCTRAAADAPAANDASPPASTARTSYERIFTISRSKNENVVSYEVRVGSEGFSAQRPIRARWQMLAEDGRFEGLTKLEVKVYGTEVKKVSPSEVRFVVAAVPSRTIVVRKGERGPEAIVDVNGIPSRLESIFIESREGLVPSVRYAELRGVSLADGSALTERVKP